MDNPNPIYYKDLITPDDSITNLIKQLQELIGVYDSAKTKIQAAAQQTAQAVQGVSGATEEQRKAIQLATEQSDKLVAEYRDISSASWKVTQAFAEANAAKKESAQIDKLITQINTSAEGSYNRLSAQYRLNKIRLNEMSAAQRTATKEGKDLEAETNAIYQEMKRLQEATGKHQLNVGNYADATKSLRQELRELTEQLAQMRLNGESSSEEYTKMSERAGQLRDAMADASQEVNKMASDTATLDSVSAGAGAVQGGLAALTSTMALMGASSENATKAQKALGAAVGVVSGAMAIQNALQKQSALMLGIRNIQTWAAEKAEKARAKATVQSTAAEVAQTTATKGATIAQRAFNLVAQANPYVLLAIALVTVVGALTAFALGTNKAAKAQKEMIETMRIEREYLESYQKEYLRAYDERIRAIQAEIDLRKAQGKSQSEINALEEKAFNERVRRWAVEKVMNQQSLDNLEANRKKVAELNASIANLQKMKAEGYTYIQIDTDLDGKLETWKIDKLLENWQAQLDEYGAQVNIAVGIQQRGKELVDEEKQRRAAAAREAAETAKAIRAAEIAAMREAQDAQLALIADGYEKELQMLKNAAQRRIEDLQTRLKTERNLSAKARQAIAEQIIAITTKMNKDIELLNQKYRMAELTEVRATEDMEIALMEDGAEKQRRLLDVQYTRRINDLTAELSKENGLTKKQLDERLKQLNLTEKEYQKARAKLDAQIAAENLKRQKDNIDLRLDAVKEGSQEEIDLTIEKMEKERQIELAENARLAEDVRQSEADINAKWDAQILRKTREMTAKRAEILLDKQQDLAQSEFNLTTHNERQKTKFALEQQAERIRNILQNDKTLSEAEIQTYRNMLDSIESQIDSLPYNNLYELLGINLDDPQQSALNTALDSIKSSIDSLADSWVQAADKAVQSADKQVEAAQKVLDSQIEAREQGYANDVVGAQKELALAQQTQAKALKEKEKAQKAQLAIDTVTQASSLITATANIWSALGGIPIVGPALALAAIAAMWLSFGAAKIKAFQVAGSTGGETEQYGEGTVELLEGGSHASGNDIDLGRKKDGTRRRAEGGEYFAIINKRNSAKYRNVIPDVINAFNNGTFADRYQKANASMSGLAVNLIGGNSVDVSKIEKDVRAIREQGDESRYLDSSGNVIIKYKNLTRKIMS